MDNIEKVGVALYTTFITKVTGEKRTPLLWNELPECARQGWIAVAKKALELTEVELFETLDGDEYRTVYKDL